MNVAQVAEALAGVYDPELGIDIVSLGLVYGIEDGPRWTRVRITVTARECPMGALIVAAVEEALAALRPGRYIDVSVTMDPPWDPGMLTPAARRQLGLPIG
jgi:metal-sulfur cluster biosynthetic enzyme